jgi:hypothetical protein
MSESGLVDRSREDAWDDWYVEHLNTMVTVPGITSAQRFRTDTPGFPPSLAMYSVASGAVFDDPYYLSVRGLSEWRPLVDPCYYRRNLFAGLEHAPDVAGDECLVLADRDRPAGALHGIRFAWLEAVGIDRSTPHRGIAVLMPSAAFPLVHPLALYRPATARITASSREENV